MHDTGSTAKSGPFSKPRRQFLITLLTTIYVMYGKVNFTNLSRYSDLSERTYRRHFEHPYEFMGLNGREPKKCGKRHVKGCYLPETNGLPLLRPS